MVLKFEEYISEGLWSKGLERAQSGEERMEDKSPIKEVCKIVRDIISKYLNIEPNDNICVFEEHRQKVVGTSNGVYVVRFNFCNKDFTYNIGAPDNENDLDETIISFATALSIGLSFRKGLTSKIKKVLTYVSDELMKIIREKLKGSNVSEGLWSKGLERAQSGGNRAEDTNLHLIKGVDIGLPFLIADRDLIIKEQDRFTMSEMEHERKSIEESGWRIPTIKDLDPDINGKELVYTLTNEGVVIGNPNYNNGESVLFKGGDKWGFNEDYWLVDSTKKHEPNGKIYPLCWGIIKDANPDYQGVPRSRFPYCEPQNRKHIRLIKDK